ncbi:hypothetical protein CHL78_013910 [Romboutsia weinsteinii]|uniref:Uncharacterized protein n=1 Tax=Romboutsia weinsteinii TaxID=2020949 RepID=A0A371J0Q3_9FIRM|nr:hypothetical protein [Romboutsia weinsteinii]RDY26349.1 hypothetical protein CHL78_013910 [Romboutsia weinsteinii]
MKKVIKLTLYILALILQISTLCGVFIVQYLTNKKAGVMRHVYSRKYQFENSIFSQQNISMLKVGSILAIILILIFLMYVIKNKKDLFCKVQASITLIMSMAVYIVISSNYFSEKLAYHYFIMGFALVLLIQMIVLLSTAFAAKS